VVEERGSGLGFFGGAVEVEFGLGDADFGQLHEELGHLGVALGGFQIALRDNGGSDGGLHPRQSHVALLDLDQRHLAFHLLGGELEFGPFHVGFPRRRERRRLGAEFGLREHDLGGFEAQGGEIRVGLGLFRNETISRPYTRLIGHECRFALGELVSDLGHLDLDFGAGDLHFDGFGIGVGGGGRGVGERGCRRVSGFGFSEVVGCHAGATDEEECGGGDGGEFHFGPEQHIQRSFRECGQRAIAGGLQVFVACGGRLGRWVEAADAAKHGPSAYRFAIMRNVPGRMGLGGVIAGVSPS
jgi:hypothetical protein